MLALIDTHVIVIREYDRVVRRTLRDLLRRFSELNVRVVVHPISRDEIANDKNLQNAETILSKMETYPLLEKAPNPNDDREFMRKVGKPCTIREEADNHLLYCTHERTVDLLITEDTGILVKAEKLGIADKVLGLKSALLFLRSKAMESLDKTATVERDSPNAMYFYRKGERWIVGKKGSEGIFNHMNGFAYLHLLLQYPNRDFACTDLYHLGTYMPTEERRGKEDRSLTSEDRMPYQQRLDKKTVQTLKMRLQELDEEISIASGEPDRLLELKEEKEELLETLKRGKKGLRDPASEEEKARLRVGKSINRVLEKLQGKNDLHEISKYLNRSTVKTGDYCRYQPLVSDTPEWIILQQEASS